MDQFGNYGGDGVSHEDLLNELKDIDQLVNLKAWHIDNATSIVESAIRKIGTMELLRGELMEARTVLNQRRTEASIDKLQCKMR